MGRITIRWEVTETTTYEKTINGEYLDLTSEQEADLIRRPIDMSDTTLELLEDTFPEWEGYRILPNRTYYGREIISVTRSELDDSDQESR